MRFIGFCLCVLAILAGPAFAIAPHSMAARHCCCTGGSTSTKASQTIIPFCHPEASGSATADNTCQCMPASSAPATVQDYSNSSQQTLEWAAVCQPNPALTLQLADTTNAPVWLHRLFYPDKSQLYLLNQRMLL